MKKKVAAATMHKIMDATTPKVTTETLEPRIKASKASAGIANEMFIGSPRFAKLLRPVARGEAMRAPQRQSEGAGTKSHHRDQ